MRFVLRLTLGLLASLVLLTSWFYGLVRRRLGISAIFL